MNENILNETVYLTFPTNRGTLELINKIAEIQGITQPKLLDLICQDYIHRSMNKIVRFMEENKINITDIINEDK